MKAVMGVSQLVWIVSLMGRVSWMVVALFLLPVPFCPSVAMWLSSVPFAFLDDIACTIRIIIVIKSMNRVLVLRNLKTSLRYQTWRLKALPAAVGDGGLNTVTHQCFLRATLPSNNAWFAPCPLNGDMGWAASPIIVTRRSRAHVKMWLSIFTYAMGIIIIIIAFII
jgi:hypothetical protein